MWKEEEERNVSTRGLELGEESAGFCRCVVTASKGERGEDTALQLTSHRSPFDSPSSSPARLSRPLISGFDSVVRLVPSPAPSLAFGCRSQQTSLAAVCTVMLQVSPSLLEAEERSILERQAVTLTRCPRLTVGFNGGALKACGGCKKARYCSIDCRK
jgi:hypothetical protein